MGQVKVFDPEEIVKDCYLFTFTSIDLV